MVICELADEDEKRLVEVSLMLGNGLSKRGLCSLPKRAKPKWRNVDLRKGRSIDLVGSSSSRSNHARNTGFSVQGVITIQIMYLGDPYIMVKIPKSVAPHAKGIGQANTSIQATAATPGESIASDEFFKLIGVSIEVPAELKRTKQARTECEEIESRLQPPTLRSPPW